VRAVLCIGTLLLFMGGFVLLLDRLQKNNLEKLRKVTLARWQENGLTILHPPVLAAGYGSIYDFCLPEQHGIIGIVDDGVVCKAEGDNQVFVPLDQVRWVGVHQSKISAGRSTISAKVMVLHHEEGNHWHASAFIIRKPSDLASLLRVIEEQTGLPPHHSREDFGPHPAQRLTQTIYGHWLLASNAGTAWETLKQPAVGERIKLDFQFYLAPDRLVYNGFTAIHLSQIRHVDLYEKGGPHQFNPFNQDLLRLEYDQGDQHQVAGFLVHSGRPWAEALQARLDVPVEVHKGSKKKEAEKTE
jgi:hypothetical protein